MEEQRRLQQRMLDSIGGNIERLDYKMERVTQTLAWQQNAQTVTPLIKGSPFKTPMKKVDASASAEPVTSSLRPNAIAWETELSPPSRLSLLGAEKSRAGNWSKTIRLPALLPPLQANALKNSFDSETGAQPVENHMGAVEYFERREHE